MADDTIIGEIAWMSIDNIKLNPDWPYRKDVGYLDGLGASMSKPHGQLQPIGVDTSGHLIWGFRRWRAAQKLGWKRILARIVDVDGPLTAMKEENENRQGLSPSELTALMRAIEAEEAKKAKERQRFHGGTAPGRNASGNIAGSDSGEARDKAAAAGGVSPRTYDAMKKIDDHGTDALKEAVDDDVISIADAASVVDEPMAMQIEAVQRVRAGQAKTVAKAIQALKPEHISITDAAGHAVEGKAKEAFANIPRWHSIDSLCRQLQKALDELSRLPGGEQLQFHLQATGSENRTINMSEHLNALKRDLKGTRPYSICPYCEGKGKVSCKGCSGCAWVTKTTYDTAGDDLKERLSC